MKTSTGITAELARKNITPIFRRRSALAGIIAPIVFTLIVVAESLARPGYSQVADFVSQLGVGPYAIVQNINFFVFGIFAWIFAFSLEANLPSSRTRALKYATTTMIVVSLAIVVAGAALILWGAVPDNYSYLMLHNLSSFVVFFALVSAQLLTRRTLANSRGSWGRYPAYSLVSGIATLALTFVLAFSIGSAYQGAVERVLIAVPFVWMMATGLKFRSVNAKAIPTTG